MRRRSVKTDLVRRPDFWLSSRSATASPRASRSTFFNYSTWTSRNGLYLEDLYVAPAFRRLGVARELMRRLEAIAVERGCGRLQWLVLRGNLGAIRFYESQSARALPEWQVMLKRLAGDQPLG